MLKKMNFGLLALVLGLGITFSMSAFKSVEKSKFTRTWYFQSNVVSEAADASKYSLVSPPPTSCESGTALPCSLTTPNEVDTQIELEEYIEDNYHTDPSEVMDAPIVKRAQL